MISKTLAEREAELIASLHPSAEAKRLAPKLRDDAAERRSLASTAKTEAGRQLHELAALHLERAAELLRILEQEQWRQREAIKLHLHGTLERTNLRRIAESWNGDLT